MEATDASSEVFRILSGFFRPNLVSNNLCTQYFCNWTDRINSSGASSFHCVLTPISSSKSLFECFDSSAIRFRMARVRVVMASISTEWIKAFDQFRHTNDMTTSSDAEPSTAPMSTILSMTSVWFREQAWCLGARCSRPTMAPGQAARLIATIRG